jgi:hypothetical protein
MYVQGLGHSVQLNSKQNVSMKAKAQASSLGKAQPQTNSFESSRTAESDRDALLQKIKGKIKSGFYSSDAVMEDLSHGFAKILDKNV